ncbi:MAG: amidohydrolase family protein [Clostridia bacterium]
MNFQKIDIHVHTREEKSLNRPGTDETYPTPNELRLMYDALGIEKGLLLPGICASGGHHIQSNEEACRIVRDHPDTFFWFCNISPAMGSNSPDADLSYFLEYYKALGAKGVGEITINLPMLDPLVQNLFTHCEKNNMPVTIHIAHRQYGVYGLIDGLGLPGLEATLARFPDLVILGHSQCFWSEISADVTEDSRSGYPAGDVVPGRVVELMIKYPNLHGDLSANSGGNAVMRDESFGIDFLEEFQDRLYFGTDICAPSNHFGLSSWLDEKLAVGKLTEKAHRNICRDNALRLLK